MKTTTQMTPIEELLVIIDSGKRPNLEIKRRLLEREKQLMMDAYNLDPELMQSRYKNANQWYNDQFGI